MVESSKVGVLEFPEVGIQMWVPATAPHKFDPLYDDDDVDSRMPHRHGAILC